MNYQWSAALCAAFLAMGTLHLVGQDDVTIPRSRLKELERKEAELEKLKGQGGTSKQGPDNAVKAATPKAPAKVPTEEVTVTSPPIAGLPPLKEDEIVDAVDLSNYYRQDVTSADRRFRKRKITVRGVISGFQTPLFRSEYRVLLEGASRETAVTCTLTPPDKFSAVFTVEEGSRLVGLQRETRIPMASVGERVLVEGTCRGLRGKKVAIIGTSFKREE